ncbi:MAG: zinc ribbon domain-containing protein, partial [Ruminococcus sp.]
MKCPKCGTDNSDKAKFCVSCQYDFSAKKRISSKKCPVCGKKYHPDKHYCMKCQCELVENSGFRMPPAAVITSAFVILAVTAAVGVTVVYPRHLFNKAIAENNTDSLADVCIDHSGLLKSRKRLEKYDAFIDKRAGEYYDDTISYEVITDDFQNFDIINSYIVNDAVLENTKEEKEKIALIHTSRIHYEEAETHFKNKKYQFAENKYSMVSELDEKYYLLAQDKLKEIEDIKKSYITRAKEKISAGDYDGSINLLTEGISYFDYDEAYSKRYEEEIISTVIAESDFLMKKGRYFTYDGKDGAFNIVYSYLSEERYSDSGLLSEKLSEIAEKSVSSELSSAEEKLSLANKNKVLDRCADKAAKDYNADRSIQDDNTYILNLCRNDDGIQELLRLIPKDKQIGAALISDMAVTADDFTAAASGKI